MEMCTSHTGTEERDSRYICTLDSWCFMVPYYVFPFWYVALCNIWEPSIFFHEGSAGNHMLVLRRSTTFYGFLPLFPPTI